MKVHISLPEEVLTTLRQLAHGQRGTMSEVVRQFGHSGIYAQAVGQPGGHATPFTDRGPGEVVASIGHHLPRQSDHRGPSCPTRLIR